MGGDVDTIGESPSWAEARSAFWLQMIGRLKPGVTREQAQTDMSAIAGHLAAQFPELEGYGANVVLLHDQIVGKIRPALLVLTLNSPPCAAPAALKRCA